MDIKRITSAILGIPLVIIILTFGNTYVVDIFLTAVALLSMQEYFNAVQKECKPIRWIGYLACFSIVGIHILPQYVSNQTMMSIAMLIVPILLLISFAQIIITNMKTNFKDVSYTIFGIIMAIIILFNHRSNIKRLNEGTENRISLKK